MLLIAHRGLLTGPNPEVENAPTQIEYALAGGYAVETDVWRLDGDWFLGHDRPQYKVSMKFLRQRGLWLHCKNLAALDELSRTSFRLNYFWHENDSYTLTSHGFIWAYPSHTTSTKTIAVMPEWEDSELRHIPDLAEHCIGMCSDYVIRINDILHDRNS